MRFCYFAILLLGLQATAAAEISYNFQIRPILSRHCISCHGPDEEDRQADLRVDTFEGAQADLGGYAGIVPGDPDKSEIIARIISGDESLRMPPADHAEPLPAEEVALLKQWITEGAQYETHWSFVPPQKTLPPEIESSIETGAVIDSFVQAKHKELGISASSPASPQVLIRRVALALTGLPPTPDMVERFVTNQADQNYEAIVDQLLASSAYGEHWAAIWLDLARYADTMGYAEDLEREIWPWRDWAIQAFNANMPYDQFTIEQLAGDLLPDATPSQRLATAFHRNTLTNTEGGTNDEEFRTIAVKDRISTTMNVWMGLTMRCAECHSHKYDPISQKEYYQFLDFFNQTADSDHRDDRPRLEVQAVGRGTEYKQLSEQITKLEAEYAEQSQVWSIVKPSNIKSRGGATLTVLDDISILAEGKKPARDEYYVTLELPSGKVTGLRLELLPHESYDRRVGRSRGGSVLVSQIRVSSQTGDQPPVDHPLSDAAADHSQPKYSVKNVIRKKINSGIDKKGWAVNHPRDGFRARRVAVLSLAEPLELSEPTKLTVSIAQHAPWAANTIGRFRLAVTSQPNPAEQFRKKKLDTLGEKIFKLVAERDRLIPVPVLQELEENQRRDTHVMTRGSFLQPGEQVSAAVPTAFHDFPADAPQNRLGVARWLVSSENPLTARVAVNRFWARIFGMGLVETEEDFGTQGMLPSHPELLDWLAVDFQENGWDVKALLRSMVLSKTFRQSSAATAEQLEADPRNIYLTRGPRFRLSAEVVRDQALAVSGLLSKKMHGPPVYPPNPIKRVVAAFTAGKEWKDSEGEDRYRRTIYTYLQRSRPHPLFETFDMATREVCSLRRFRTNTPLQSFMTLNDPMFLETAQALAANMLDSDPDNVRLQIEYGLTRALLRPPTTKQVDALVALYNRSHDYYQTHPAEAAKLTGIGIGEPASAGGQLAERASLTVVANIIMNFDGFLNL